VEEVAIPPNPAAHYHRPSRSSADRTRASAERQVQNWHPRDSSFEPTDCRFAGVKLTVSRKFRMAAVAPKPTLPAQRTMAGGRQHCRTGASQLSSSAIPGCFCSQIAANSVTPKSEIRGLLPRL